VSGFLIIIALLALFWFVAVLPRRRRMQQHKNMQDDLAVGNEVITAGGLHGTVRELGDAEVRLEISEGVVVTVDRRAVAAVATEVEEEIEPEPTIEEVPVPRIGEPDEPR